MLKSNGLFTKRIYNQTVLGLFSALIGSVFGALGTIGQIMAFVESKYKKISTFRHNKRRVDQIIKKNKKIQKNLRVQNQCYTLCSSEENDQSFKAYPLV